MKKLSKQTKLPTFRARTYLKILTDTISDSLAQGEKVELENFGVFTLVAQKERTVEAAIGGKKREIKIPAGTNVVFNTEITAQSQPKKVIAPTSVDEFKVVDAKNTPSGVRFIELSGKAIPKDVLSLIPETIARKYQAVPFLLEEKNLSVAMTDPENEEAFNIIRKHSGKIIKPFLTTKEDIAYVLDQYSSLQNEMKELVEDGDETEVEEVKEIDDANVSDDDITEASPASKIISSLLKRAVREKASDIHIEPSESEVQVRFRVDGVLRKILSLPKEIQPAVISRVKILSNLKIDETRLPQDGRIQIKLDGNKVDFRISTIPTVAGEKIVARVLDSAKGVLNYEQLGLTGRLLKTLQENTKKAHGMMLVTGPTGSGKSTTLYAIISELKDEKVNIITLEDPVEYRMPGVNQCQVNAKIGYTFASGLRSILRQDPNIVMVGEIRDRETADIAINAALTGHIVLSSLHTNDAAGALPRLLDMDIEPFLITSSTNAIIAQRLCRKICEKCRKETEIKPSDLEVINQEIETLPNEEKTEAKKLKKFYIGEGCSACGNTGYKGRIGIFEILTITEPVKQLTLKHASSSEILSQAIKDGFITMKQDGILKALSGLTTIEEVWRVTKI